MAIADVRSSRYCVRKDDAYSMVELMVVMSVIAFLLAVLTLGVPAVRSMALQRAAMSDISLIELGAKSFEDEWGAFPPSGNSALTAALMEGSRQGAFHAKLNVDRVKTIKMELGALIDPIVDEMTVSLPQLLPTFSNPEGGAPLVRGYGAVRVEEEWIVFRGIEGDTLIGCRRGQFGTVAVEHDAGREVVMLEYRDPWGRPYAYTRAGDYGQEGTDQMLTRTGFWLSDGPDSNCDKRTSQPEGVIYDYENCGRFQLVSPGPDKKFWRSVELDGHEIDDIRNW